MQREPGEIERARRAQRPASGGIGADSHRVDHLAVLDASPNAIVGVNPAGRITYANLRVTETFGWSADELIGQPVERLIPDRVTERHVAHRSGFFDHPAARPMGIGLDLAGQRKDGSQFPVEISLSPVRTDDGMLVFATVVDITARKSLEGQLLQAQKMESIGRLAGGIAHDFNNMLFAIRGYADLLIEDIDASQSDPVQELRGSVEAIRGAADRAAALTGQLLAFSRQQVVSPRVIDVNTSVAELEPMVRPLIGENVELKMTLKPDAGRMRVDAGQLDQIVVNLVINARDALPVTGGRVTIETGSAVFDELYAMEHVDVTPGQYVMLAVSDNGSGMDAETRERIFEPFFTTKEHGRGTGLGLATTYGIVRQAGGHIWLYSEVGHGTTFKIYFPRVTEGEEQAPPVAGAAPLVGAGRVLVVEDEGVVRELTTRVLERAGFEVIATASGSEALSVIEREGHSLHALVTDVVMPGMSGPQLAEHVLERYPSMRVVLLSGYTAETLDLAAVLAKGAAFLGKPFNREDLVAAVTRGSGGSTGDPRA
jgi:two-component system, cell cycle sensor histidine kinase and response regulator CckA